MNIPNARERILDAAVKIFAEKSFDGSRIDEIAAEAKVPKSLIYYHFKNKDEILEILIRNFIDDYLKIIDSTLEETPEEKVQQLPSRMKNVYYEFGMKNADLVRVIFIDSLKKTKEEPIFFRIVEAMVEKEKKNNSNEDYDKQERQIVEFFTSFIPNCAYICFADSWIKYFNVDRKRFDELYLKAYNETHGAYHENHK